MIISCVFRLPMAELEKYIGKKVYLEPILVGKVLSVAAGGKMIIELCENNYPGGYRVFLRKEYVELMIE